MDENKPVNLDTMSFERFPMWTVNSSKNIFIFVGNQQKGVSMIWLQGRNSRNLYFVETFVL